MLGHRLAHSLVGEAERGSTCLLSTGELRPSINLESRQSCLPHRQCPIHGFARISASSGQAQFTDGSGSAHFSPAENSPGIAVPMQWASRWRADVKRLRSQLNSWGVSGLLAYGVLNTLYYSGAFLVIWTYFAKVPRGLGWSEVTKQFATVMGLTWAASQVTKIPRAALALVMAPVADGLLIFVQARCRLRTRRNAFGFLVAVCLLLAGLVFGGTLLWWA